MSQTNTSVSSDEATDEIVNQLDILLADYQVLYQKLRAFHWNVEGPDFYRLHEQFEELYNRAKVQVDEIAERIRALDAYPTSTYSEQLVNARLSEDEGRCDSDDMVRSLVSDYETLNGYLKETASKAESAGDTTTMNLLEDFAAEQEETVWMLKSFLNK